jgi:hypothetical protein
MDGLIWRQYTSIWCRVSLAEWIKWGIRQCEHCKQPMHGFTARVCPELTKDSEKDEQDEGEERSTNTT